LYTSLYNITLLHGNAQHGFRNMTLLTDENKQY